MSFREDNFTVNTKSLEEFCEAMLTTSAKIFSGNARAAQNSALRLSWCGVETVNPKWQKWSNKLIPPESVIKFYDNCQNIGIKTGALFMLVFPYQTEEELKQDVDFAMRLPVSFSAFQVLALFPEVR